MSAQSTPLSVALQEETLDVAHIPDVTSLHIIPLIRPGSLCGLPLTVLDLFWTRTCAGANMWLLVVLGVLQCASAYDVDLKKLEGLGLAKARVEVKAFVVQDIPLYHNLVMKHIPGADPELVLLNHYYEELERIPLSDMTRSEINELLSELGFYKKHQAEDEVPEEFRFSPAKDSPFKDEPPSESPATSDPKEPASDAKHTDL